MSAQPKPKKLTVQEYLAIERAAEFKSEFFDGVMYPMYTQVGPKMMAGASRMHNTVKENLIVELGIRFKGGPCRTFSSDQRVRVDPTGLYTYPDIVILCGPGEYDPNDENTLLNPTAIVEVLSESTERYDRRAKFRNYQEIASFREYILAAQDEPVCERYVRQANGDWLLTTFAGLETELVLSSAPARIPLAEIYAGVTFPDTPPR